MKSIGPSSVKMNNIPYLKNSKINLETCSLFLENIFLKFICNLKQMLCDLGKEILLKLTERINLKILFFSFQTFLGSFIN